MKMKKLIKYLNNANTATIVSFVLTKYLINIIYQQMLAPYRD